MFRGIYDDIRDFYLDLIRVGAKCTQFGSEEAILTRARTKKCGSNQNWESVVMKTVITRFAKDESGVTAIEYGLIAAIVGLESSPD